MKKILSFSLGAVLLLGMAACSKTEIPSTPEAFFSRENLVPCFDSEQFKDEVAYLGGMSKADESWIRARSGKGLVTNPLSAQILILGGSLLDNYLDLVNSAYQEGKVIIVGNPDLTQLKETRDTLGWHFVVPNEKPKSQFALVFCKDHSLLLKEPAHIITDPEKHETVNGVIEIKGEKEYEGKSFFLSGRALMNFIARYKKEVEETTKSSISATTLEDKLNTNIYEIPVDQYFEVCMRGRYLRVFNSYSICYNIYPCYIPQGVNNQGDYYTIQAKLSNFAPTMYEYKDPDDGGNPDTPVGVNPYAHYWPREYSYWGDCQFRGPYNTEFLIYCQAKIPTDLTFSSTGRPSPGTDVDTKTFTDTQSFSWEVGLSGGWNKSDGFNLGFNAGISGSKENSVSYSMSDMRVVNNSNNNSVKYDFIYQNLPSVDSDFDNYESQMPYICKSTADFEIIWEWTSNIYGDYNETVIPLETYTEQSYNIWARDKDIGIWHNYMNSYTIFNSDVNTCCLDLARIPIGCLRILNKCWTNKILYNIKVNDSSTGEVVYEGNSNVARDEYCEVLLPQKDRKYNITLSVGKNSYEQVQYYSYDSEITLPLALSTSDTDKKIVTMVEGGGDFSSKTGYLRIINQSSKNLIRNLCVCTASGETVYTHKSSLGYAHVAEIFLSTDTEYYVTMEFGSASSWKPYRSEENFTLPLYTKDTDILTLIANDNEGGDFILE